MKNRLNLLLLSYITLPYCAEAADAVAMSPTGGVFKMVLGLAIVLAVMAIITWLLKRMVPGVGSKQSVIRIVGGVSVGSRERVVVLEVAGRWLVVGVAPGQVNRIANLEIGSTQLTENVSGQNSQLNLDSGAFTQTFAHWLTKSTGKVLDQSNVKK